MKKLLITVAATACLISAAAFTGCVGGEATVTYALSEDGTYYTVSGVQGNTNALKKYEVPAEYAAEEGGELLPVKAIGDEAFFRCSALRTVTLPEGLEVIGEKAFAKSGITSVTIPDTVTSIGYAAFFSCSNLTQVIVPESVTFMDRWAFVYCSALERAEIRAHVTEIKEYTFSNRVATNGVNTYTDTSLTQVYISSTVTRVNKTAFYGNFLTDIYFGGSEEEWKALYCYEEKKNGDGEIEENAVEKQEAFGSATIHFNSEAIA